MLELPVEAAIVVALTAPVSAIYTECTVTKDVELANRLGGNTDLRFQPVDKSDKVAFRE